MMQFSDIGYHESPNVSEWFSAVQDGVKVFQVMLGNPRSYTISGARVGTAQYVERNGISLIVHGPYVTSHIASPNTKIANLSALVLRDITQAAISAGAKHIVLHVGGLSEDESVPEAKQVLSSILLQWAVKYATYDITLCMETDPGSKNGRRVGGIKFLYPIIRDLNCPNVRLCWDWEHSWANGFDIRNLDIVSKILDVTSIMHMNAIPHYVERGSHLDRHSETLFSDSQLAISDYENIVKVAQSKKHRILGVLERRDYQIARRDMETMKSWGCFQ